MKKAEETKEIIESINREDEFLNPDYFKKVVKYGDVIVNHYASKQNPHRKGYFVGFVNHKRRLNGGKYVKMTNNLQKDKGSNWEVAFDQESRFSFA